MEASTFKEAIGKHKYAKDEWFINSIYDFYHYSLLKADKKQNVITRESILKTIGKTQETSYQFLVNSLGFVCKFTVPLCSLTSPRCFQPF